MKNSKIIILLLSFFAVGALLSSCGDQTKNSESSTQTENMGKEYTSAYVCPMHCEGSGSDQPGTCPVCNMDYVKNETLTYACPMHPEVTGKAGEKCSKCEMDLTAISEDAHKDHNH